VMYGARIITVDGSFDDALRIARDFAERSDSALVNSVNPYRIEGQASAAYEICETLGDAPDLLALPVGNGGNITAYWLGFNRAVTGRNRGPYGDSALTDRPAGARATKLPRLLGMQAEGAAPLVLGAPVPDPETVATAIRIGHPATWQPALDAAAQSGGAIRAVSDDEILEAYRRIAALEGVFCEPASAAGVAGLRAAVHDGTVDPALQCVCVLTGHGLKDPDTAVRGVGEYTTVTDAAGLEKLLAD
jgi:threonine synthase